MSVFSGLALIGMLASAPSSVAHLTIGVDSNEDGWCDDEGEIIVNIPGPPGPHYCLKNEENYTIAMEDTQWWRGWFSLR